MYCRNCGTKSKDGEMFCSTCGYQMQQVQSQGKATVSHGQQNLVGFSTRINDPAFKKYVKNSNRYVVIFSLGLAIVAFFGFTLAGEMGWDNLENPMGIYIGMTIGGMFLLIGLYSILSRKSSKTWDGMVVDKDTKRKTQRHDSGDDVWYEDYVEYQVVIRRDSGKQEEITSKDDDTRYNYYKIGDKVRHHGGLNSYEKYDKSGDHIIFCNACATLCDIEDEVCPRCHCPLLK